MTARLISAIVTPCLNADLLNLMSTYIIILYSMIREKTRLFDYKSLRGKNALTKLNQLTPHILCLNKMIIINVYGLLKPVADGQMKGIGKGIVVND